jgi:hypothetical protein
MYGCCAAIAGTIFIIAFIVLTASNAVDISNGFNLLAIIGKFLF